MDRQKKQHLKQRADGRYRCAYNGKQFYGNTEAEALAARDEYKRLDCTGKKMVEGVRWADRKNNT